MPLVTAVADRLLALDLGRGDGGGTSAEVLAHPVVASYLGTSEAVINRRVAEPAPRAPPRQEGVPLMQPADDGGSARSNQLRRYGPVAIIVVLLVVIAGIVVVAGGEDDDDTAGESGTSGGSEWTSVQGREPGAPEPTGEMPVTYAEAEEDGTLDDHTWSDTCDTDRGTITVPSVYAPPCVPAFEGDNGGATSPASPPTRSRSCSTPPRRTTTSTPSSAAWA